MRLESRTRSIMASEQDENIKFVLEVEKYPCLYNYNLPDYMRKNVTDKAWAEIAIKFNITASDCKEKWRNIRNVFVRNQKPPKSGSGTNRKRPYYLNEVMQFTLPFIKLSNVSVTGNLPPPPENTEIFNTQISDVEVSIEQPAQVSETEPQNLNPPTIPSPSISLPTFSPTQATPSPSICLPTFSPIPTTPSASPSISEKSVRSKKNSRKTKTSIDEGILNYFQNKQARKELCVPLESQPKKMFLLSLLPDLESMSDRQMRKFKQRVVHLIEEILEEEPRSTDSELTLYYQSVAQEVKIEDSTT